MLFALDFNEDTGQRNVSDRINEKAEFILERDDAIATMKVDGVGMKLNENGEWFSRRSVKPGKRTPNGFILEEEDNNTGIKFGWEPIEQSDFKKFFLKALNNPENIDFIPGTYELIGPKINGNKENVSVNKLILHGSTTVQDIGYDFPTMAEIREHIELGDLKNFLEPFFTTFRDNSIEGIVWWVDNNPAVKLRAVDFFPELDSRNRTYKK